MTCLELPHLLGEFEPLGQQENKRRINIVDACADAELLAYCDIPFASCLWFGQVLGHDLDLVGRLVSGEELRYPCPQRNLGSTLNDVVQQIEASTPALPRGTH